MDAAPPVMALNGINPVIIVVNNGPYVDAGATAYDLCGRRQRGRAYRQPGGCDHAWHLHRDLYGNDGQRQSRHSHANRQCCPGSE